MKTLLVMRHAKSSWDSPQLKDFARPLAQRGLDDIPKMAARLRARGASVEAIVCSPAERTLSTAALLAAQLGLEPSRVNSNPELYFAGAPMLLRAVQGFDDGLEAVMLVGHNPAVTDFVNALAGLSLDNVPTGGILEFSLPIERWSQLELESGTLLDFDYPKREAQA